MIEELGLEEIMNILDEYKIIYEIIPNNVKGNIDYVTKEIRINPMYNEDADTLLHEFVHHYFDIELSWNLPEKWVELEAQHYLEDVKGSRYCLEDYIYQRTKYKNDD